MYFKNLSVNQDWFILLALLILSMIGVCLTDGMEHISHWYWITMVPIFFAACLYTEFHAARISGLSTKSIIIKQTLHWLGLLLAVQLTYFLREIGSFNNASAALVLLLLFAMATFHAGVTMGWLFRLLGIFLACSLVVVAYVEHFILVLMVLFVGVLLSYHYLRHRLGYE